MAIHRVSSRAQQPQSVATHLLGDFKWLCAKLNATDIAALISDFDGLEAANPLRLVKGALRLASSYLWIDKTQLASQLAGRLPRGVHGETDALIEQLSEWRSEPWLRPLRPTLHTSGGALERVFRGYAGGHRGTVRSIAIDGTGQWAVSAGNSHPDQCLIVWNLATGTHQKLEQQALAGGWTPLAMSSDGSLFISGYANQLRAWRRGESEPFAVAPMADACVVNDVVVSADGMCVIAAVSEGNLAIWEPASGTTTLLGSHGPHRMSLALTPDGSWAVSMNGDDGRLWNVAERSESARWPMLDFFAVQGNTGHVGLADDGHAVVWMDHSNVGGHALQQWNRANGEILSTPCGKAITGLHCIHFERQRAVVATTQTQRSDTGYALLTFADAPTLVTLADIGRGISSAAISRDGRWAITADYEHDLMVWNLDRAVGARSDAHDSSVPWRGRRFDGFTGAGPYAVFGFDDEQPLVWDVTSNVAVTDAQRVTEIVAHEMRARELQLKTPKMSTAKKTSPGILRKKASMIDSQSEALERGHTAPILGRAIAPHARWEATASEDGTMRVWDFVSERVLAVFSDETIFHTCVWAEDGVTLAVTDYRGRAHLLRLEGVR